MENKEKEIIVEDNVVVEEKKDNLFLKCIKGFGIFIALFAGYFLIPQIVGAFVYSFGLSENLSMTIGNTAYLITIVVVYHNMLLGKIKDYKRNFPRYFGNGLKWWSIGFLVMAVSNIVISYITGDIAANEEANREFINGNLILGFYSVVIMAPLVEEMIFRYGIRKMVPSDKVYPMVSGILFGLAHIVFANAGSILEYLYVIPYGALGYAFGYAYVKTDNIFTSVVLHMMHNFVSFTAVVMMAMIG